MKRGGGLPGGIIVAFLCGCLTFGSNGLYECGTPSSAISEVIELWAPWECVGAHIVCIVVMR